jgi:predicted nucleic acid-binding protein
MRPILLDTNIVSYLFLPQHALYQKCIDEIGDRYCCISFMTRGELLLWPKANRWGAERQARLFQHFKKYTTLFPDEDTCVVWADIMAESRQMGRPIEAADAWVAATAKRWDLALMTADHRDFNHLSGLTLIPI